MAALSKIFTQFHDPIEIGIVVSKDGIAETKSRMKREGLPHDLDSFGRENKKRHVTSEKKEL